jgi:hypothetical protein
LRVVSFDPVAGVLLDQGPAQLDFSKCSGSDRSILCVMKPSP